MTTKLAIVLDGNNSYPILRRKGLYYLVVDDSGRVSHPFLFKSDVIAINWFRRNYSRVVTTIRG